MRHQRIPGFAVCACCAGRGSLHPCATCGMLACGECRGNGQCTTCWRERARSAARAFRRARFTEGIRQVGAVACVAACGMAAVGAAMLPEPPLAADTDRHLAVVARGELRFVGDAVERWAENHAAECPPALNTLRRDGLLLGAPLDPWGEPLMFGCVESPLAFVVMSKGPDREAGTADDMMLAAP